MAQLVSFFAPPQAKCIYDMPTIWKTHFPSCSNKKKLTGGHVELDTGADDADGNLGAVGGHDLAKGRRGGGRGHEVGNYLGSLGCLDVFTSSDHGKSSKRCRCRLGQRGGSTNPDGGGLEGPGEGGAGQGDGCCREGSHIFYQ